MSFEEKINILENILEQMSNENITLQEGVDLYNKALILIKECDQNLKDAKGKIEILDIGE